MKAASCPGDDCVHPGDAMPSAPDLVEPGLTEAWAAAEAALPEGSLLSVRLTVGESIAESWDPDAIDGGGLIEFGDTPAAALLALAAALRSHTDG